MPQVPMDTASATVSSTVSTDSDSKTLRSFAGITLRPKTSWPNPLDSLGDPMRPMRQHMKKRKRWGATGPAAEAFLEICDSLQNFKESRDDLVEIENKAWPWGWSFCMAGRSPEVAKPYIVVHCESKSCCLRILQVIESESWWQDFHTKYPSIGFVVDTKAPRPLQMAGFQQLLPMRSVVDTPIETRNIQERLERAFAFEGRQITLRDHDNRKATIGGVLIVGGRPYGFTASHPFSDYPRGATVDEQKEIESDFDDVEFLSDSEQEDGEELDSVSATSQRTFTLEKEGQRFQNLMASIFQGRAPNSDYETEETNEFSGLENMATDETASNTRSPPRPRTLKLDSGTFLSSVTSDVHLDWALIPLEILVRASKGHYPLCKTCGPHSEGRRPQLRVSKIVQPPYKPADISIISSSVGKIRGRIGTTPFIMRLEGRSRCIKTYAVILERDIAPGDCGAWVFDNQRNLYGHVIAGQPGLLTAFIVPASDVYLDIKSRTLMDVRLEPDYLPYLLKERTKDEISRLISALEADLIKDQAYGKDRLKRYPPLSIEEERTIARREDKMVLRIQQTNTVTTPAQGQPEMSESHHSINTPDNFSPEHRFQKGDLVWVYPFATSLGFGKVLDVRKLPVSTIYGRFEYRVMNETSHLEAWISESNLEKA